MLYQKHRTTEITEKEVLQEMSDLYDIFGMGKTEVKPKDKDVTIIEDGKEVGPDFEKRQQIKVEEKQEDTKLKTQVLIDRLYEHGLITENGVKKFSDIKDLTSSLIICKSPDFFIAQFSDASLISCFPGLFHFFIIITPFIA